MSKRAREKVIDALFTNGHPYVALEAGPPFNFRWELAQVREIIRLWDVGVPICDIADQTDRDPDEVAVLIVDLAVIAYMAAKGFFDELERRIK